MTVSPTRDQFREAAQGHLRAARAALGQNGGQLESAAYLAHVATECILKFRLLAAAGKTRTADMRVALGEKFRQVFESKAGHDLSQLAQAMSLKRMLVAEGNDAMLESEGWKRMVHQDRPYGLRYGVERLQRQAAIGEVEVSEKIVLVILASIK